jgi:signal peptidase I
MDSRGTRSKMNDNPRRPWIAAVLTLFVPGLGQLYAGEPRRALVVYLGNVSLLIGLLVSGVPRTFVGLIVFILMLLLFLIWAIWDAIHIARLKTDYALRAYNRWYLYIAVILVATLLSPRLIALLSPIRAFRIPGGSMEPAVLMGDHIYADITYYRSAKPARGDLVVFTSPDDPERIKIGRIIGLEGEQIETREKMVYVNGQQLADPWGHYLNSGGYLSALSPRLARGNNFGPQEIPLGTVFVLADDRDNSIDSRSFGPVPLSSLRGRLLYIYWATDKSRIGTHLSRTRSGSE